MSIVGDEEDVAGRVIGCRYGGVEVSLAAGGVAKEPVFLGASRRQHRVDQKHCIPQSFASPCQRGQSVLVALPLGPDDGEDFFPMQPLSSLREGLPALGVSPLSRTLPIVVAGPGAVDVDCIAGSVWLAVLNDPDSCSQVGDEVSRSGAPLFLNRGYVIIIIEYNNYITL